MAAAKKTKPIEPTAELEPMLTRLKLTPSAISSTRCSIRPAVPSSTCARR